MPQFVPPFVEVESSPDSNDTRMQQTWYVDGTLYGALDTAVRVAGQEKAGVLWFAVRPDVNRQWSHGIHRHGG